MSNCKWNGRGNPRVLPSRHDDLCNDERCRGCQPCGERHCGVCGIQHVTVDGLGSDQTCPDCLAETRTKLAKIAAMSRRMLGEAITRGVNSEAAMLAGPTADPETWQRRHRLITNAALTADDETSPQHKAWLAWIEDCRDERHPLWVLGTWEQAVREHLDQPSEARIEIDSAWSYLDGHLTRLAHDPGFAFDELTRDVNGCHSLLEDVLHDGEREIHGAPCVKCHKPLLRDDQQDEESWWCERCKRRSNADQYRLAVSEAYRQEAKRLTAADLAIRIGVAAGTIRRWASKKERVEGERIVEDPPLLHSAGVDSQGRKVYDVQTAERLRDRMRASPGADAVA